MQLAPAIKERHRPVRLAALERARIARSEVAHRRKLLRTVYFAFSTGSTEVEDELAGWQMEWREALAEMVDAKRGLI